jgi:hypothetical protein
MMANRNLAGVGTLAGVLVVAAALVAPAMASEGGAAPVKKEEAKPGTTAAPATAAPKAPAKEAAPARQPAAPPGPGMWASIDDFLKRTGKSVEESRLFGLRIRPSLSESVSYTDNAFYQSNHETFIETYDTDKDWWGADGLDNDSDTLIDERDERVRSRAIGIGADGIDNDTDGRIDERDERRRAVNLGSPHLGKPRGQVSEIVNIATAALALEMPLNPHLVRVFGDSLTSGAVQVFRASATSVEYMKHGDSPDAFNYTLGFDLPILLNEALRNLLTVNAARHAFFFRLEGDYSRTTDPLDVAKFEVRSSAPTFVKFAERNTFERVEWYAQATVGWQSPVWDTFLRGKHYRFRVNDSTLDSADHRQSTLYHELGYTIPNSEHRVFTIFEYTDFGFDARTATATALAKSGDVTTLRDFERYRTGLGWEGPLFSKKIRARAEGYWIATEVDDNRKQPYRIKPDGTPRTYDEVHLVGGSFRAAYRPYASKSTQLQVEYSRLVTWSVVAENKIVDRGSISLTHPLSERLTGQIKYTVEAENVAHAAKRTFEEVGLGLRYRIFSYTDLTAEYTFRRMRSRSEHTTDFADRFNEVYSVRADGDFRANIITLGITVAF